MTERERYIAQRREELLTVKEYADTVKTHPESIRRRIRQGRQPGAVRVGGQWRIDATVACCILSSGTADSDPAH